MNHGARTRRVPRAFRLLQRGAALRHLLRPLPRCGDTALWPQLLPWVREPLREVQMAPTCPLCEDRASPADLRTNHTLNNLVEKLLREEAEDARWTGPSSQRLCRLHRGQLSLFCLEDKELLCCSCQTDPATGDIARSQ
ncbi:Hypothetical predicted protein [Marmota monax]|uniref:B box-type domain-containing protein n=1 Tax=Marmota monax TaxID=9995 RepID=A0A5E4D282_MARMO|nr:Hypothetical predicted protein [Marmota monax]